MGSTTTQNDPLARISQYSFQVVTWTLCGFAVLFLASRVAIRLSTKGKLMMNDYFLLVSLPALYAGAALLQSSLDGLYAEKGHAGPPTIAPRLTAAIDLLWISIYFVKFCFLAQFKFHKPPYAYISDSLTRHYWIVMGICVAAGLFTFVQPIVLCHTIDSCRYFEGHSTVPWEIASNTLDIATDLLVISIPIALVQMANYTRINTIINASFKSLSVFSIAIASTRLALSYDRRTHRIRYSDIAFWLVVEAAVALIMAGISSYRTLVIDWVTEHRRGRTTKSAHPFQRSHEPWIKVGTRDQVGGSDLHRDRGSELSVLNRA
ncbi:hypothetical protein BU24DRAFT_416745 [Aaosphaeria arxii CBS 175.79]|uniref:Rhodopsin domain-containing protein n=1 Tax=Aaosphaeria arxii CBS 175.79 TaxID=1450172 RepID=A0A6A5Y7U2_9PLEO|nr:uncharacterized protein BU24DRAFT_416745 [Aaosphaeria arxii CBS 175.79]KAF2021077.1 hypothetical protein BU24DRAFT_416745 [Aaosphaeria arxii CBS 175.79]